MPTPLSTSQRASHGIMFHTRPRKLFIQNQNQHPIFKPMATVISSTLTVAGTGWKTQHQLPLRQQDLNPSSNHSNVETILPETIRGLCRNLCYSQRYSNNVPRFCREGQPLEPDRNRRASRAYLSDHSRNVQDRWHCLK